MRKLSVLIPTVTQRPGASNSLFWKLMRQMGFDSNVLSRSIRPVHERCAVGVKEFGDFEVIFCGDDKEMTIGEKRNILYREASGLYSWQIDDDDDIHECAIKDIVRAMHGSPDCITFEEYCEMNGNIYQSNHSLRYNDWMGDGSKILYDGFHFQRTPFFKDVIKTEIAKKIKIPHIRFGEDAEWAKLLKPHLKTEEHIEKEIYRYIHNSKPEDHAERYGLDKV